MAGKWHLTGWRFDDPTLRPEARGFDKFFGSLIGEPYFQPKRLFRGGQPAAPGPGFYYTNAIADEVVSNLREVARDDVPFFYYVPFTAPHAPIEAPADSIDTHENVYEIDRDEIRRERQERLLELGLTQEPWWDCAPDPAIPRWERGGRRERETQFQQTYAAMVTDLDRAVGSIVSELDRTGMLDNTLVLVLSDNGATGSPVKTTYQARGRGWANVSNAPFRGYKSGPYEGGISSPFDRALAQQDQGRSARRCGRPCDRHLPDLARCGRSRAPRLIPEPDDPSNGGRVAAASDSRAQGRYTSNLLALA